MWRTRRRTQPCILLLDMAMPLSPRPWPVMELTSCVGAQGACYLYTWPVLVATLTVWRHSCLAVSVCLSVLFVCVLGPVHMVVTLTVWRHCCLAVSVCLSHVCLSVCWALYTWWSLCVETLLPRSSVCLSVLCLCVCWALYPW